MRRTLGDEVSREWKSWALTLAIRILDKNIADWDAARYPSAQKLWYTGRVICCLLRPGVHSTRELEHIKEHTARRAVDLGMEFIMIDPKAYHPTLEAVSSTEIRALLAAESWNAYAIEAGYILKC